jgi:superfamily II DNA or RNA helicase
MEIELGNFESKLIGATEAERDMVWNYLVVRTPKFTRDFRTGRAQYEGEQAEHMFDLDQDTFPSGFATMVRRKLAERGVDCLLRDVRIRPAEPDWGAKLDWLRDYQFEACQALVARTRGLLQMGTGGGKTEVITALLRIFPELKFVILVHRTKLMHDIVARIQLRAKEHGLRPEDVGRYGDGYKELGHRITVCSFDSIKANRRNPAVREMLANAQAAIIDEAHTLAANSFAGVMMELKNAYYRWGVSGTPLARGDKRSSITIGLLGPIVYKKSAISLIEEGILAQSKVRMVKHDAEDVYSALWAVVRERGIVTSVGRNRAVLGAAKRARKPAMMFVDVLDHGQLLLKGLKRLGLNAEFVFGAKNTQQREAALRRLVCGDIDVLISSPVFNEGIDVPTLGSVLLAGGGKSVIGLLQRIGRGMRRSDGKEDFEVWDFEDRHNAILEKHFLARRAAYKKEGHAIQQDTADLQLSLA